MLALILGILLSFLGTQNVKAQEVVTIPPMPSYAPALSEEQEWELFWLDAYCDNGNAFDEIYASLTYKRTKNGRSMVNGKFVKMGA